MPIGTSVTNVGVVVTMNTTQFQQSMAGMQQTIVTVQSSFQQFDLGLRSIDRILEYMAAGSVVALAEKFLKLAGELEQLTIKMAIFEGSTAGANQKMDQLVKIAGQAPFSLKAISDSFVKLKAAGIEPLIGDSGKGPLTYLIDAVAKFGGSTETFKYATLAIQQMAGKGVISMEELRRQLGEAIPDAIKTMAEGLGISVSDLTQKVTKGLIDADAGLAALFEGFKKHSSGAAALLNQTLLGSVQQFKTSIDTLALTFNRAGQLDFFTALVQKATVGITLLGDKISSLPKLADFFDEWAPAIGRALGPLLDFIGIMGSIGDVILKGVSQLPPEMIGGGILGFLIFGRKGLVVGALFGEVSTTILQITQMIGGVIDAFGVSEAATGGLIGFMLFGRTGAFLGVLITLFDTLVRELTKTLLELSRLAISTAAGVYSAITGIFNDKSTKENFVSGFKKAGAGFTAMMGGEGNFAGPNSTATGPIADFLTFLKGSSSNADAAAKSTSNFSASIKDLIDNLKLARQQGEGAFSNPDPIEGPNVAQQKIIAKFTTMSQAVHARLQGAESGGNEIAQLIDKERPQVEAMTTVIDQLTATYQKWLNLGNDKKAGEIKKDIDANKAALAEYNAEIARLAELSNEKILGKIGSEIRGVTDFLNVKDAHANLGPIQEAMAQVNKQFDAQAEVIQKARLQLRGLIGDSADAAKTEDLLRQIELRLNVVREDAIRIARINAQFKVDQRQAAQDNTVANLKSQATELTAQNKFDDTTAAVAQVKAQFRTTIFSINQDIAKFRNEAVNNPALADWADVQIKQLEQVKAAIAAQEDGAVARAIYQTSTVGKMWDSVGHSIETGLGAGLEAIIYKTGKLKDVLMTMYSDITKAAIQYLIKAGEAQIFSGGNVNANQPLGFSLMSMFGGASATGAAATGSSGVGSFFSGVSSFFSGLFAANGAIVPGNVKMMANGGLIRGPTLFGMAGEAGTEAIMPLETVGGKLGVRSTGHGGSTNHFHISAVDGQSVARLFYEHGDKLVASLDARRRLNRGLRV